jgi:hypothetical protein
VAKYQVRVEMPGKSEVFTVNAGTEEQARSKALRQFCMTTKRVHANQVTVSIEVGMKNESLVEQLSYIGG